MKSYFCFLSQENYDDPHKTPASPVVHIRGLIDGVVEADLVEALQEFGPIRYASHKPNVGYTEKSTLRCSVSHWFLVRIDLVSLFQGPLARSWAPLLLGLAIVLWIRLQQVPCPFLLPFSFSALWFLISILSFSKYLLCMWHILGTGSRAANKTALDFFQIVVHAELSAL